MNERNLEKINSMLGYTIFSLNTNYNEEDAKVFDRIITSKLGDLPILFKELFDELLSDAPEELKDTRVFELIDILQNDTFG